MNTQIKRCDWCVGDPLYEKYHDQEWGVAIYDDLKLFEFLTLETFQAGLSWITILRKRENFRTAFDQFDFEKVALYGDEKIKALLNNEGIVRNKQKILAAVNNAQRLEKIRQDYGSFSQYIWRFVDGKPLQNGFKTLAEIPAKTPLSEVISKDLKQNGFQFVGPTVIYSHMQATGMVNDHLVNCYRYDEL
ncbi:MAG: DNA-3-methyladenine glycosylase I [Flavobacteriaceae bacterium]|jgi:DNA-3-methyladenine glycosylase I